MRKFKVINYTSKKRTFLGSLNAGTDPNVTDVSLLLLKQTWYRFFFPCYYTARGVVSPYVNLEDYIKIGDIIDFNEYPMLEITKE